MFSNLINLLNLFITEWILTESNNEASELKQEPVSPPPEPSQDDDQNVPEEVPNHEPVVEIKEESQPEIKQEPIHSEYLTEIKGFENWTRSMIKDFIESMGKARQKYNALKEQDPNTDVRQVAMLLDEWKFIYPDSQETVQSFVEKVRHLKAQKELIKKHLAQEPVSGDQGM